MGTHQQQSESFSVSGVPPSVLSCTDEGVRGGRETGGEDDRSDTGFVRFV